MYGHDRALTIAVHRDHCVSAGVLASVERDDARLLSIPPEHVACSAATTARDKQLHCHRKQPAGLEPGSMPVSRAAACRQQRQWSHHSPRANTETVSHCKGSRTWREGVAFTPTGRPLHEVPDRRAASAGAQPAIQLGGAQAALGPRRGCAASLSPSPCSAYGCPQSHALPLVADLHHGCSKASKRQPHSPRSRRCAGGPSPAWRSQMSFWASGTGSQG